MLYFKESDLAQLSYNRYLVSAQTTLETAHIVGNELYQNHINFLARSLSKTYKIIIQEGVLFRKYKKKQNKYDIKLIKLDFKELSEDEIFKLKYFKRKKYYRSAKKYARLHKKLYYLYLKYRLIIADCDYEPEIEDEPCSETTEIVQENTPEENIQEYGCTLPETLLSADNETLSDEKNIVEVEETSNELKTSNQLFDEIFVQSNNLSKKENEEE